MDSTLDVALRYAPSYLVKGLISKGTECVYVDGKSAPGMRLRDFVASDVALVEVYGWSSDYSGVGLSGTPPGGDACGLYANEGRTAVATDRGTLHYAQRPDPGVIIFAYIWLKQ